MSCNEHYNVSRNHYAPRHSNCGCARNIVISNNRCNVAESKCHNNIEENLNVIPSCDCNHTVEEIQNHQVPPCTTTPVAESCVDTFPVAMAYVPMQQWRDLYDPCSGLSHGTIFRELNLEWYKAKCRKDHSR